MSGRAAARVTHNFDRNLESIQAYLKEKEREAEFEALLDELFAKVIPALESFPEIGFDFLARRPLSHEGLAQIRSLSARLSAGASLREYIFGDYLILYMAREDQVHLLAIKHHLQLSFDLRGHWVR